MNIQGLKEHINNNQSFVIEKTKEFVYNTLAGEGTGHDWYHVDRVTKLSLYIAQQENANMFIVELAALLHDIADHKFHNGDETIGPRVARQWLESINVSSDVVDQICDIIATISFRGAKVQTKMKTLEGQIVQDADRIDALGAIGIARCFAYGWFKHNPIYDPDIKPIMHSSFEDYKNAKCTSINHFYEKLLLLKDLMNTKTGKAIAQQRHDFIQAYLDQFFDEWNVRI
jgi:uncharacterized protein